MPKLSTIEAIFMLGHLIEKYRGRQNNLSVVFIDLEKVYVRIPMELIWWTSIKKMCPSVYSDIIKDMY